MVHVCLVLDVRYSFPQCVFFFHITKSTIIYVGSIYILCITTTMTVKTLQ